MPRAVSNASGSVRNVLMTTCQWTGRGRSANNLLSRYREKVEKKIKFVEYQEENKSR